MWTILLVVGFFVLLIAIIVVIIIYNSGGGFTAKYDAFKEVFPVLVKGKNALGEGGLNGFSYAYPEQINDALENGLRIPGVTNEMYALYGNNTGSLTSYPNIYKCSNGDFYVNTDIQWPETSEKADPNESTYICFLYGYKPLENLTTNPLSCCEAGDQQILPFSQLPEKSLWNSPVPSEGVNFNGEEPFIIAMNINVGHDLSKIPFSDMADSVNNSGFNVATNDQCYWARSNGMGLDIGLGDRKVYCFKPIMPQKLWPHNNPGYWGHGGYDIGNYMYPLNQCIQSVGVDGIPNSFFTDIGNNSYYTTIVWGVKKNLPDKVTLKSSDMFGKFTVDLDVTVLPFNGKKKSYYG